MKKRGFTLLEMMIVVGITLIMFGVGSLSVSKYNEGRDSNILNNNLITTFHMMAMKASDITNKIYIIFDYENSLILFKKEGIVIEKFELPKGYTYSNTGSSLYFTDTGNVSQMFSFFVKTKNGNDVLKLTFSSVDKFVKSVHIRQYVYSDGAWIQTK